MLSIQHILNAVRFGFLFGMALIPFWVLILFAMGVHP